MKQSSLKERIVKNSFWSFTAAIVNRVGALIFTIILTRFLMPEGFGIYSIVLSVAMIFYTFTDIGVNQAATRYIAYSFENERKKISAYYSYLLKVKFSLSIVAASLLFLLAYPIAFYFYKNPVLFVPLLIAAFYIFVMAIESFYSNLFYAVERAEFPAMRHFLEQTSRIALSFLVFFFVASSYQVVGIFSMYILVSLFLLLFNIYYLRKLSPLIFKNSTEEVDKKRINKFVGFLTIAMISGVFFSYIDAIMLGLFLDPEFVGYYRAAFSLVFGIAGILLGPVTILLPYFARINKIKSAELLNHSFNFLSVLSLPCLFGLLILGKYFVRLFFGYPFIPSTLPLYFLSLLLFPLVSVGPFLSLFSAEEKPEIFAKLILVTSVINIILNFVLIKAFLSISPLWATAGAGIATTISWFFYFFSFIYVSKRKLGLEISFSPVVKPLVSSIIMSLALLFVSSFVQDMSFLVGLGEIFFAMLVYFVSMILLKGITIKDLNLLKMIFKHGSKR